MVAEVGVVVEFVSLTTRGLRERPLEFLGREANHVGVAVDQHVLVIVVRGIDVDGSLLGQVGRFELNMVVVAVDAERTLEQRVRTIFSDIDPCPSGRRPSTFTGAD